MWTVSTTTVVTTTVELSQSVAVVSEAVSVTTTVLTLADLLQSCQPVLAKRCVSFALEFEVSLAFVIVVRLLDFASLKR